MNYYYIKIRMCELLIHENNLIIPTTQTNSLYYEFQETKPNHQAKNLPKSTSLKQQLFT